MSNSRYIKSTIMAFIAALIIATIVLVNTIFRDRPTSPIVLVLVVVNCLVTGLLLLLARRPPQQQNEGGSVHQRVAQPQVSRLSLLVWATTTVVIVVILTIVVTIILRNFFLFSRDVEQFIVIVSSVGIAVFSLLYQLLLSRRR